jgi:TetR/AcrR family tetracycline transcriptional repressor
VSPRKTDRPLDLATVVDAALRVADREGLQALTMRRLAAECGVTAMAVYRHVESKDALIDVMVDHVLAGVPVPDREADWRDEMLAFFLGAHALLVEHPAVAHIMAQRPLASTAATALADRGLAVLVAAGFDDDLAVEVFLALGSYALGGSLYQVGRSSWVRADLTRRFTGLTEEEHPTLTRVGANMADAVGDALFTGGLRRLIDSYATSLPAAR